MLPRSVSKNGSRAKQASAVSPAVQSVGSGSVRSLFGSGRRSSNSVHPVAPPTKSSSARRSTVGCESVQQTVNCPEVGAVPSAQRYCVKVRALHGIDLHVPNKKARCQHAALAAVGIAVNGGPLQSCTAAQHARNHTIWKKHELKFPVDEKFQQPQVAGDENEPSFFISMYVSLTCTPCSCAAGSSPNTIEIGEVGELQLPAKESGDYEISRFFPVLRRQQQSSQAASVLVSAGKLKLSIRVEVEKAVPLRVVALPDLPKRPPFALPTNLGEALQLKRKQLKPTVVPEDNSQRLNSQPDPSVAIELLREITVETAPNRVAAADLRVDGRIGEGIHSCVSLGTLRRDNNGSARQVAVKEFRHQHAAPPVNVLRAFQQEYRILEICRSQNGHQHVVEILGVTLEPRVIILMEYFSRGSLAQCLQDDAAWSKLALKQKAALGLKIAKDIAWLHKHDVIHRDIKSHNVLVGGDVAAPSPMVKLGDLGSAIVHCQHEPPLMEEIGSSGNTAPEVFTHGGYDSKVDVWSFGIVLWELASSRPQDRSNPFVGLASDEFVSKAESGCRPSLAHAHQLCLGPVVEKCWSFDPLQRPTMHEVVGQLEQLCNAL